MDLRVFRAYQFTLLRHEVECEWSKRNEYINVIYTTAGGRSLERNYAICISLRDYCLLISFVTVKSIMPTTFVISDDDEDKVRRPNPLSNEPNPMTDYNGRLPGSQQRLYSTELGLLPCSNLAGVLLHQVQHSLKTMNSRNRWPTFFAPPRGH